MVTAALKAQYWESESLALMLRVRAPGRVIPSRPSRAAKPLQTGLGSGRARPTGVTPRERRALSAGGEPAELGELGDAALLAIPPGDIAGTFGSLCVLLPQQVCCLLNVNACGSVHEPHIRLGGHLRAKTGNYNLTLGWRHQKLLGENGRSPCEGGWRREASRAQKRRL